MSNTKNNENSQLHIGSVIASFLYAVSFSLFKILPLKKQICNIQ
jgi:hypothetical protein